MIIRAEDRCKFCVHYLGGQKCRAFNVIPAQIWQGEVRHDHSLPGDNGIVYQSRQLQFPDADAFLPGGR